MDIEYLKKEWENAITNSRYNKIKIKSKSEMKIYWDKLSKYYDIRMTQDKRRIYKVFNILNREGYFHESSSILDIGSGTGIYTIPMAKYAKEVTAIDNSSNMCSILREKAHEEKINNLEILNEDWNSIDLKALGLYKKFDLAISSLNPSINSFEALCRMNESSKGYCCLISWSGAAENKVCKDLNRILINSDSKKGGYDIYYSFSILYAMGYHPKLDYVDFTWTLENSYEEAVERLTYENYWVNEEIKGEIKNKISSYVEENMNNRIFKEEFKAKLGIITWSANI